jgi:diguanylate cyclase (GGDEF)-like protein
MLSVKFLFYTLSIPRFGQPMNNKTLSSKLNNRLFFESELFKVMATGTNAAILLIGVDRFKYVNEGLGYEVGDLLLQAIESRLKSFLGPYDIIARLLGDEFVIILPDVSDEKTAVSKANQILQGLNEPFWIQDHEIFMAVSIGISFYPKDDTKPNALLQKANVALYNAKLQGGNVYHIHQIELSLQSKKDAELERDLRRALIKDEFILHYQPIANIKTKTFSGLEALIRWQHPAHGLLMPGEFIALAEQSGLIIPIGKWVLMTACEQNRAWQRQGLRQRVSVAVNLSARQIREVALPKYIEMILKDSGLEPQYLELELTESVLMHDLKVTNATLKALKSLGVKIAIDDFGTGYSSLSYLQQFTIDRLKIDKSFISQLANNVNNQAIVKAIIAMAHTLGIRVIAEGVETSEQYAFLADNQCDELQGYFYSHPLSVNEVVPYLEGTCLLPSRK